MIKISSGVYIHFLTVVFFAVCFAVGRVEMFFMTYAIMTLHELAHLAAALVLGLKPSRIVFFPFGVNLRLKNNILCSAADEIILYGAGPLVNILLATGAKVFFSQSMWAYDFYRENIVLFVLNLLPILPLDGGIILKNIMARNLGYAKSTAVMRCISAAMLMGIGYGLFRAETLRGNFSFWFFAAFLCGNIFTAKEKYNPDILRELIYADKSNKRRARVIVMKKGENMREILKEFTNSRHNILCIIGENGEIEKFMSEREVIRSLTAN